MWNKRRSRKINGGAAKDSDAFIASSVASKNNKNRLASNKDTAAAGGEVAASGGATKGTEKQVPHQPGSIEEQELRQQQSRQLTAREKRAAATDGTCDEDSGHCSSNTFDENDFDEDTKPGAVAVPGIRSNPAAASAEFDNIMEPEQDQDQERTYVDDNIFEEVMGVPLKATIATSAVDIERLQTEKETLRLKLEEQRKQPPTREGILKAEIVGLDTVDDSHSKDRSASNSPGKCWVIVAILFLGVIAAVIIAVTISQPDETSDAESLIEAGTPVTTTAMPSNAVTSPPTGAADFQLNNILDLLRGNDFTYNISSVLPVTVAEYEGSLDSPEATPQEKALSWLLYHDDGDEGGGQIVDVESNAGERWALASMYFQMGGPSWNRQEKWLSSESFCDWEDVTCGLNAPGRVQALDLGQNNLVGTIPSELALLHDIQRLSLGENELIGTIPGELLGSLPNLLTIRLNNNQLTGTLPDSLLGDKGFLNMLLVQFNLLTGSWPVSFCRSTQAASNPIEDFGLDCDRVDCPIGCCDTFSCYRDGPVPVLNLTDIFPP